MVKKVLIIAIISIIGNARSNAQCISTGPNSPTLSSNNTSVGTVTLQNTGNVYVSDNSRASGTALVLGNKTHYLVSSGYGFALPSYAVICGITVDIEKRALGLLQEVEDYSVKIVKAGAISGNDKAQPSTWDFSDSYTSYGGPSDLWGVSWTPADINSSDFGVAISADLWGISVLPSAQIDHVKITVFYDVSLPMGLLEFKGERKADKIELNWTTFSETNNDYFRIEQSYDNLNWEIRGKINGAGNSSNNIDYYFEDVDYSDQASYYRLVQVDYNGQFRYSDIIQIEPLALSLEQVVIYPNPTNNDFTIDFLNSSNEESYYTLYNYMGQEVKKEKIKSNVTHIYTSDIPKGIYILIIERGELITSEKIIVK